MARIVVRWLLVPVAAAVWIPAVYFLGRAVVVLAARQCAPASFAGGSCVEGWHTLLVGWVIHAGVLLGAAGLVLLPALVAPRFRRGIGVIGWLLATAVLTALWLVTGFADLRMLPLVAVAGGGAGLWWVWHRSVAHA